MVSGFLESMKQGMKEFIFSFGPKLIYAAIALLVGYFCIKLARGIIMRLLKRAHADLALQGFVKSISTVLLWAVLLFVVGVYYESQH
jgi:small conductance mechanosensitive channel